MMRCPKKKPGQGSQKKKTEKQEKQSILSKSSKSSELQISAKSPKPSRFSKSSKSKDFPNAPSDEDENTCKNKKKIYSCEICGKQFDRSCNLSRHRKTHIPPNERGDPAYECEKCKKRYTLKESYLNHLDSHEERKCDQCGKSFKGKKGLFRHKQTIHGKEKQLYICDVENCGKKYRSKWNLVLHKGKHDNKEMRYKCDQCDKDFARPGGLIRHKKIHLPEEERGEKKFVCDQCGKSFRDWYPFRIHRDFHNKVKCDQCGECFSGTIGLLQHMKRRHGKNQQNYECYECGKTFKTRWTFALHNMKHENDQKGYRCETCGKEFGCKGNLKKHIRTHIPFIQRGEYICHKCGELFRIFDSFKSHLESHDRVRCSQCGKSFSGKRSLVAHEKRRHKMFQIFFDISDPQICENCGVLFYDPDIYDYHIRYGLDCKTSEHKCDDCKETFYSKFALDKHKQVHDKEKTKYRCEQCGTFYSGEDALRAHTNTFHPKYFEEEIIPDVCSICSVEFYDPDIHDYHNTYFCKD